MIILFCLFGHFGLVRNEGGRKLGRREGGGEEGRWEGGREVWRRKTGESIESTVIIIFYVFSIV